MYPDNSFNLLLGRSPCFDFRPSDCSDRPANQSDYCIALHGRSFTMTDLESCLDRAGRSIKADSEYNQNEVTADAIEIINTECIRGEIDHNKFLSRLRPSPHVHG